MDVSLLEVKSAVASLAVTEEARSLSASLAQHAVTLQHTVL